MGSRRRRPVDVEWLVGELSPMSIPENKRTSSRRGRERLSPPVSASARKELSFALNEARALLTAAHIIESTVGPLAWCLTPEKVQSAAASVRKQGPNLIERFLNLYTRMERLAVITSVPASEQAASPAVVPISPKAKTEENHD